MYYAEVNVTDTRNITYLFLTYYFPDFMKLFIHNGNISYFKLK